MDTDMDMDMDMDTELNKINLSKFNSFKINYRMYSK